MTVSTQVKIEGLEEALRKLSPELYRGPLRKFLTDAGNLVVREAKHRAPVDTGLLRRSITKQVDKARVPAWAKVGSPVEYAPYMEHGTGLLADKPGGTMRRHWPPSAALETWARRHGIPSGFLAARAIGLRGGLAPRRYLRDAFEASKSGFTSLLKKMKQQIAANVRRG